MVTNRPFEELNLWQRIFAEHWEEFANQYEMRRKRPVPENWDENVHKMLLIRIWSKDAGMIYEIGKNDPPACEAIQILADTNKMLMPSYEQLTFAF